MPELIRVSCPNCGSEKVVRRGRSADGKRRYPCRNEDCGTKSLMTDYEYDGKKSDVRKTIADMSLGGGGIRDIASVPET